MLNRKVFFTIGLLVLILVLVLIVLLISNPKRKKQNNNIAELMDKNKPTLENASASNFSFVSEIDESDHVWGDTKAPVQLIVFNDFECEFCASFQKTLDKIKEVFGDKVVVAYRHFPLRSNTNAYYAALASECAAQQGKFWEMHDRLFVDNTMKKMTFEQYKQDASELDLDIEEFVACYEAEEGKEKIQADIDEAKRIGVTGAPQTFLNGQILPGAYPFEDFTDSSQTQRKGMKTIIEEILAN